jgi:Mrp family chromosome partitioning ATPase
LENPEAFGPLSRELLEAHGIALAAGEKLTNLQIHEFAENLVGSAYFRGKDEDLIEITCITRTPEAAVASANLLNAAAIRFLFDYESKEVADIEEFLDNQIMETQNQINDLSRQVEEARSKISQSDIYTGLPPQQSLIKLTEEFEMAKIRIQENQAITEKFRQEISGRGLASDRPDAPPELRGRLIDKYNLLREERQGLESKFKAISERLRTLSKQYRPEFEQKAIELNKKLETEYALYQELKRQLSDMNVFRISVANKVRPHSLATANTARRESSLSKKLVMSGFTGLAVVFIILYMLEQMNPVILSKDDLTSQGVVTLGTIPKVGVAPGLFARLQGWIAGMPIHLQARHKERLAFQFLRNRLMNVLKRRSGGGQVIAILSADPNDGKSFVCANLASLMGRVKLKTLVIDFDIVKSAMSGFFKSEGANGVLDYLESNVKLEELVLESEIPNVYFLPSGPKQTKLESLSTLDIKSLLNQVRKDYDVIILDTPAYMARPESLMIANESDHLVVVANFGTTKLIALRELLDGINPEKLTHVYGILNRHEDYLRAAYHPYYVHAYSVMQGEDSSAAS